MFYLTNDRKGLGIKVNWYCPLLKGLYMNNRKYRNVLNTRFLLIFQNCYLSDISVISPAFNHSIEFCNGHDCILHKFPDFLFFIFNVNGQKHNNYLYTLY